MPVLIFHSLPIICFNIQQSSKFDRYTENIHIISENLFQNLPNIADAFEVSCSE